MRKTFSFLIAFILAVASLGVFAQFPSFNKENNIRQNPAVSVPAAVVSKQFEIKPVSFGFADRASPPDTIQNLSTTERTKPIYNRDFHYAVFYPPEKLE